jgi:hypothetical protein
MRMTRRNLGAVLAVLIVGAAAGTASAWVEAGRYVYRPAFIGNTKIGNLGRMQTFTHGAGGSPGALGLVLDAWNASGTDRTPGNAVTGRSYVGFIKHKPGGFDFCGEQYVVDIPGWQSFYHWQPAVQPQRPPCGDGHYQVVSCSESHSYRKVVGNGEIVIGRTVQDCSNILNWSFSGDWHPWCSNCPTRPNPL